MIAPRVVVLDYGSGNVHSVAQALEVAGARVELTRDRDSVLAADGLVVPGVGAFTAVMEQLNAVKGSELIDRRLVSGKPVLGICVGLQVMFEHGVEHGIEGAGGRSLRQFGFFGDCFNQFGLVHSVLLDIELGF